MNYRLYQPEDFAALYAIEEACFQPPLRFPRGYMRRLVHSANAATWIAEQQARIAGFAIVEWSQNGGQTGAYVQTIEVASGQRGQGVGSQLLSRIEGSARAAGAEFVWLHVDAENASAMHLYEVHGYRRQGREEHYYGHSRPALVYAKPLASGGGI